MKATNQLQKRTKTMLCADKRPVGFRGTSWGSAPLNMVVEMLEIALNIVWGLRRFAAICIAAVAVIEMSAAEPKTTDKGEFKFPPIFSDHMVLQQGAVIPVWGVGPNFNFRLSCRIGDTVTWTQTDSKIKSGHGWDLKFYLPPLKAGGPYEMVITNETTKATLVIRDVTPRPPLPLSRGKDAQGPRPDRRWQAYLRR